jgi:hypothetical protein
MVKGLKLGHLKIAGDTRILVQERGCGVQVDGVEWRLTNVHGEVVKDVLA